MEDNKELTHWGIKGMKWGQRRYQNQDGSLTPAGKERYGDDDDESEKDMDDLTDSELKAKITRLELEKRYKDLTKSEQQVKKSRGKEFVMNVLEQSGKNIATQFVTYALGTAVNKTFAKTFNDPSIVNPKKGQKDK